MRWIVYSLMAAAIAPSVRASEPTAEGKFASGLRERGLFDFAADYCRQRLKNAALAPARRADCTVELCRAIAALAPDVASTEREPMWQEADAAVASFVARHRDDPRAFAVRLYGAATHTMRGELALREAEVSTSKVALDAARSTLMEASRELAVLERDVAVALRQIDRPGAPPGDVRRRAELLSLENDLRRAYARSQQLAAECYAPRSTDRIDALTQAMERLKLLIASEDAQEALSARLEMASCYRLLGDHENARGQLNSVSRHLEHAPLADRLAVEKARLAIAERRWNDAAVALGDAPTETALSTERRFAAADRQFARLELALAQWDAALAAKDAQAGKSHVARAAELARSFDAFGPYWQRRAQTLLASRIAGKPGAGDSNVLITAAENLVHAGRLEEAVKAYQAAALSARSTGDSPRAFDLLLTAAAIDQRRGALESAIERFRRLAEGSPEHPKAPIAHLQAAWAAGQHYGKRSEAYRTLLADHLRRWPEAKTADDARWWLGKAHQERGEYEAAAAQFRQVRPDASAHADAVHQFHVCTLHVLRRMRADKKPHEGFARSSIEHFTNLVTGKDARWPECLTQEQREAVIAAATLRLDFLPGDEAAAEGWLRPALKIADGTTTAWQSQVRALLVTCLVRQEKFGAAKVELANSPDLVGDRKKCADARSGNTRQQQTYAEFLMATGEPESLRSALEQWRSIERRTPPGTPDWFRAKYWIAVCHEQLGDKQQAARIVTVLAGLHPDLGGPELTAKFQSLLKRCQP
jgi:TolA-binding protein